MKALVVMNSTNVKLGGGIIQVILNYKDALEKAKIETTYAINCIEGSKIPDLLTSEYSKFVQLPNKKKNLLKYCKVLNGIIKSNKFDVIHVHGNSANMFIELGIAKKNKIKTRIAHSHNSTCSHPLINKFLIPILRSKYTQAIACSKIAGEWLFGNDFIVLNNAIKINDFIYNDKIRVQYRNKLNITEETKVIGHIGNLGEQKNQKYLLNVFKKYHEIDNNSIVVLIGEGNAKNELKELVKNLGIDNCVIFLGLQTDVMNWLQAFDLLVFPSKWEGFGIVLLEAQASGLNIISSNVVPNCVKINENIIFLDLLKDDINVWVNQMKKMLSHNYTRTINIESFKDYNIDVQCNKLIEIYKSKN